MDQLNEKQRQEIVDLIKATMLEVLGKTSNVANTDNTEEKGGGQDNEDNKDGEDNLSRPQVDVDIDDIPQSKPKDRDMGVYSLRGNNRPTPSSSVSPSRKKSAKRKTKKSATDDSLAKRSGKGVPARAMEFDRNPNRPNLFEELGFDQMCKDDVEIDKKLNEGRTPSKRNVRQTVMDVECSRCGREYTVSNQLVRKIGDELVYICDRCVGKS